MNSGSEGPLYYAESDEEEGRCTRAHQIHGAWKYLFSLYTYTFSQKESVHMHTEKRKQ